MEGSELMPPFPLRKRPRLKSETCETLVRIFSLCGDPNYVPRVVKFDTHLPSSDDAHDDGGEKTGEAVCDQGQGELEVAGSNCKPLEHSSAQKDGFPIVGESESVQKSNVADGHFEGLSSQDRESSEVQVTMDETAHRADGEYGVNLSTPKDEMVMGSILGINMEESGYELEHMDMDDISILLNDEGIAPVHQDNSTVELTDDQRHVSGVVASLSTNQELSGEQIVVDDPTSMSHLQGDLNDHSQKIAISSAPTPMQSVDEKYPLSATKALTGENEIQHPCTGDMDVHLPDSTLNLPQEVTEEQEVEEGEISDSIRVDGTLSNMRLDDIAGSNKLLNTEQVSECIALMESVTDEGQKGKNKTESGASSFSAGMDCDVANLRKAENHENNGGKKICEPQMAFHGKSMALEAEKVGTDRPSTEDKKAKKHGCIFSEDVPDHASRCNDIVSYADIYLEKKSGDQGAVTTMKESQDKKKRRTLSKERKEKKKLKERRKRAQKNRELGVKRLKLQPVLKEKTVTYCRHYLQGRCTEGEKCKFSHDTVPLTKSTKPCCHFARNSCMKGDDCPFDHQLSKYPCSNYASKGFCSRGNNCMFSHKMEDSTIASNTCNNESNHLAMPLIPKKQLGTIVGSHKNNAHTASDTSRASFKYLKTNMTGSSTNSPVVRPERGSSESAEKSSLISFNKSEMGSSSAKDGSIHSGEDASGTVQNVNAILKTTPLLPPKGVNFLSFGSSLNQTDSKKPANFLFNTSNVNMLKHAPSTQQKGDSAQIVNDVSQPMSMFPNSNEATKRTEPVVKPPDLKLFSARKALLHDSITREQSGSSSVGNDAIDRSLQGKPSSSSTTQSSSMTTWKLPVSPITPGQPSDSMPRLYRNISNSAQKALSSTLAFAAMFETDTRTKHADGHHAVGGKAVGESAHGLQNDSAKASKILDFLANIGKKKQ
ncbi:hypothetical protein NL676_035305 [Syzygium grande]|nr:hypothetical protein NL676_035305 [Syzygium grande]